MKILLVSLSNIGDALLTLPALWRLRRAYPDAELDVVVGERAADVFIGEPRIHRLFVHAKRNGWRGRLRLVRQIRRERYDRIVDLRRSGFGLFGGARRATPLWRRPPSQLTHMRDRHRWCAETVLEASSEAPTDGPPLFWIGEADRAAAAMLLEAAGVAETTATIAVAPGARSHLKRWREDGFAAVADALAHDGKTVLLIGDDQDRPLAERIRQRCGAIAPINLCGRTSLRHLGALLARCQLLITNDSAPMHLATLLGVPVLAIFGPTDPRKYGPTGPGDRVVRLELFCSPCERAQCPYDHECMRWLTADQVLEAAREMLDHTHDTGHMTHDTRRTS